MTSALAAQQRAIVDALFLARQDDAVALLRDAHALAATPRSARGLDAYRSNGHALAQRALAAAYPTVAALLGEANFAAVARELWVADPPARGDLAHWGDGLARLIEQLPQLGAEPYLADVARVEWQMHRSATESDAAFDAASFALLAEREPDQVTLRLAPGACCIDSRWPVASIVLAHRGAIAFDEAREKLGAGAEETALVWRAGWRPCVRASQAGERAFIAALQERRSLADSLQAAPQFDFASWLAPAVQEQLLLAAVSF